LSHFITLNKHTVAVAHKEQKECTWKKKALLTFNIIAVVPQCADGIYQKE